jgi:gluconate 5-dehydrogenase
MDVGNYLKTLFSLEGKIALITGAGGGIGSALTKGLAGAGATVVMTDISMESLDKLIGQIDPGNHKALYLDVSDLDSIRSCVADVLREYGRIDILVNCAGINKREGFLDVEESTYDRIMNVNLKGVFFLTQEVVRISMRHTGGKIINIGSYNSTGMLGGVSVYGATKSAIAALTRSMAVEWAKFNIQANCIAPGHILTELTKATWENEHRAGYLRERIAAGRPGNPEEIVGLLLLLASDASSYMTGHLFNVDGGALIGGKPWQFDTKY